MCDFARDPCAKKAEEEQPPPAWEGKTYVLTRSANFDAYLRALGVGPTLRKMASTVKPEYTLEKIETENEIKYQLSMKSPYKSFVTTFKPNEKFKELTVDGRVTDTMLHFEKDDMNTLVQVQCKPRPTKIVREFTETTLTASYYSNGIKSVRVFEVRKPEEHGEVSHNAKPVSLLAEIKEEETNLV